MTTRIPIEPYWENAALWFLNNRGDSITEYHKWLGEQGIIGLPRPTYTPYLEFEDPCLATIFMLKWL